MKKKLLYLFHITFFFGWHYSHSNANINSVTHSIKYKRMEKYQKALYSMSTQKRAWLIFRRSPSTRFLCDQNLRKKKKQNKKNFRADWSTQRIFLLSLIAYTITCKWNCKSLEIDADYQHNGKQYRNSIKLKRRTNFIEEHRLTQLTNFATQHIKTNDLILWPMRKYFLHT